MAPYSTYHYRVVATDSAGTSHGADQMFTTSPGVPSVVGDSVTVAHAERAIFHGQVNPNGANTQLSFQYITDAAYRENLASGRDGYVGAASTAPGVGIGMSKHVQSASRPGDRACSLARSITIGPWATNEAGEAAGFDNTFTTFAFDRELNDHCPNAHVRQQTGSCVSARLPRLRARLGRERGRL